ncbi:hypothetical protein E0H26_11690 [Micromonospora zingiberis]|uniref:Uncharacterized protein n=1 Tax=Micromonospora zingiberis TaxID=2053011 RepID=A0A4R0GJ68_9ACTN|nr:hypothetical protein [Micromonospora zingiberis]TCB97574.1 hypothetical protein E0H26_11690 [Micromonospora zingiberis]
MIAEYLVVATDEVLDTITVTGDQVEYATGAAKAVVAMESRRRKVSQAEAARQLAEGWANGYLQIRRRP